MVQHNGLALEFQTVPDAIHSDQAERSSWEQVKSSPARLATMPSLRDKEERGDPNKDVKFLLGTSSFSRKNFLEKL